MTWDPAVYMKFGAERTRPAAELLARVPVGEARRAADLGCGPGNSTALLAARWPGAALEGIDNSRAMLEEAGRAGIAARWVEADIAAWRPTGTYDVIFANAAFQWVPDHETLLPRLMAALGKGGALAFQMPRNFDAPAHAELRRLASDSPWAEKLAAARDWWNVLEPEDYYAILEGSAARIDIWETRYHQVLDGEDAVFAWMRGTGARPYLEALAGAEREEFAAEYRARLRSLYPQRAGGKTLYPFLRLFVIATR